MAEDFRFDWDDRNIQHLAQHDIQPEEAEQALKGALLDLDYRVTYHGEERWTAAGQTGSGRILVIVWTMLKDDSYRVITAIQPQRVLRRSIIVC